MSGDAPIDVWNIDSFDPVLRGELDAHAGVIRDYMTTDRLQWEEREATKAWVPYPDNPYAGAFIAVKERVIMPHMAGRAIRAWHYTRMTDAEIEAVRRNGIYLSSLETIRSRFDAQVAAGAFDKETSDRLFADSPYQSEQLGSRSNKFWMVSHPQPIDGSGVELLLESWGGESAYFWQRDPDLQTLLKGIGRPRVLEISIPLLRTKHSYSAAMAVVATYGRYLGCRPDRGAFDLYLCRALGPDHILAVHSEGERNFAAISRGYPPTYVATVLGEES